MRQRLIRYLSYPLVVGGAGVAIVAATAAGLPFWPWLPAIAAAGLAAAVLLERVQPYETAWLYDHADTATDIVHALVNLGVMVLGVELASAVWPAALTLSLWPSQWPVAAQWLLAGLIVDAGMYAMHRASHAVPWLWALHTPHHSAERLYWLNSERRHPLHAVVLAGPGIAVSLILGAPAAIISAWLAFVTVHLAFQHANLDYTLGPLNRWLGVAPVHRWHHKREYEDAQVNYGEFWMIWDRLFGTFHLPAGSVRAGDVGLTDRTYPTRYVAQIARPFQRNGRDPA